MFMVDDGRNIDTTVTVTFEDRGGRALLTIVRPASSAGKTATASRAARRASWTRSSALLPAGSPQGPKRTGTGRLMNHDLRVERLVNGNRVEPEGEGAVGADRFRHGTGQGGTGDAGI